MLPELDGLRAVASYGILTTHVAFQTGTDSPLLERFDYFVAVFYALSAFLLARGGDGSPGSAWRAGYYSRRLARLAPAYLVCVAVVLLSLPPLTTVTARQALANLLLLQIYVPGGLIDGLTQMWSLCVEVAFYLVLPAYLRLGERGRWVALSAAVPLGLLWPHLIAPAGVPGEGDVNLQIWPCSYAPWFAVGLVLAELERHGVRYLKLAVVPSGVPGWILPLLVPLEIISNFIVRPLTHSLRLMATMLSGHMIVMLAGAGAAYLITQTGSLALQGTGILVILGSVALYFLELLIMYLQAFVFTLLTAIYIQGAIDANDH